MTNTIVQSALGWIGTPYRHQSSLRGAGCDCLGLLRGVWREVIGPEPGPLPSYRADWRDPTSADALLRGAETHLRAKAGPLEAGDVVLFRLHPSLPPKHCAIMVTPSAFVHAQEQLGVVRSDMSAAWMRRVSGIYQFPAKDS